MIKPSRVIFANDKLETSFNSLDTSDPIRKAIVHAVHALRENAFSGIQVPKKIIPKEYVRQYGVNNLWKYDMPKGYNHC
jgi:hypothetical protein